MTTNELVYIQSKINYQFHNPHLLQQAFIRRSYSQENPEWQNNEILEFIGDSELDSFIVHKLCDDFSNISNSDHQFYCKKNEGDLTKLKAKYVDKESLAHCIEFLEFNKYLIMGKCDINNNAQESLSVKEDLLEAIVGAVAVDSEFNRSSIAIVCNALLGYIDFNDDYIKLVEDWCKENNYSRPQYSFPIYPLELTMKQNSFSCKLNIYNQRNFTGICKEGNGSTKELAMMDAAETLYYDYCEIIDMRSAVGEPCEEFAISQLHELSQKGFFDEPNYSYEEKFDDDGCLIWKCNCKISNYDKYCWATASTKKEAKRKAAFFELQNVLELKV